MAWDFANDIVSDDTILYAKWIKDRNTETPRDVDDSFYLQDERIELSSLNAQIGTIKTKVYDGKPYLPTVKVTAQVGGKKTVLTEGTDYRVLYQNNVNAGTGKLIVKGNGIYKGVVTKNFTISKKPVGKLKVITGGMGLNSTTEPPIYVYDGGKLLVAGVDYTLYGTNGLTASLGKKNLTLTATEKSNYSGSRNVTLQVYNANKILSEKDVRLEYSSTAYTGKALKPSVKVVFGGNELDKKAYTVKYTNNKEAGTAYVMVTGKKDYAGCVVKTFEITPSKNKFELKKEIAAVTYNGKLQKPKMTVTVGGKALKQGRDYILFYSNNLHATQGSGKAAVTVRGIGNYAGVADQSFYFTINSQKISRVAVKVTKDALVLTYAKRTLKRGTDYEVSYGAEVKGKVEVTITGKSDFTGSVTKKVKVK